MTGLVLPMPNVTAAPASAVVSHPPKAAPSSRAFASVLDAVTDQTVAAGDPPATATPSTAVPVPNKSIPLHANTAELPPLVPSLPGSTPAPAPAKGAGKDIEPTDVALPTIPATPSPKLSEEPPKGATGGKALATQPLVETVVDDSTKHAAVQYAPVDVATPLPQPIPLLPMGAAAHLVRSTPMLVASTPIPASESVMQVDTGIHLRIRTTETGTPEPPVAPEQLAVVPVLQKTAPPPLQEEPPSENEALKSGLEPAADRPVEAVAPPHTLPQRSGDDAEHNPARKDRSLVPEAAATAPRGESFPQPVRGTPEPSVKVPDATGPRSDRQAPPAASVPKEIVSPEPQQRPPLRSVSLDFTPDGAGDVRLKLAERGGEVHVSLHSSDAVLTHQMREGIHDLASVLAGAGYDAEAWTSSGQGREQGRQQREQQQPQHFDDRKQGEAPAFDGFLNQTPQEVL